MSGTRLRVSLALLLTALAPCLAAGQTGLDPGRLPKSTVVYLAWHGTPAGDARKANSLLALWDDADFAPVREALMDSFLRQTPAEKTASPSLTKEDLLQFAGLLENEFVAGYVGEPRGATKGRATPGAPEHHWNGSFFVYDRTGKEATVAKLLLLMRMDEKDAPKISTTTLAGIPVVKVERKAGTSYMAEDGRYAFSASEPAVFEQIAAWTRHSAPEAASLSQTAAYREARELLKGGMVELFVQLAGLQQIAPDASAGGFRLQTILQSLRIEAVHSLAVRVSLEGERTRVQGALLGDTSAGTVFDFWDEGTSAPASLRFVTPATISYHESQFNLPGIYAFVRRAVQSASGGGQAGPMETVEAGAKARLGMTIPEALAVFSGEFASLQSSSTLDPAHQFYVVGIREKAAALKLLRAALADRLASERTEGDVTFLKVSQGGMESTAGTASWKYYHLAVTPDAILASSRSETLRAALAADKSEPQLPPEWQEARTRFPPATSGFGFVDLQKIDWAELKQKWNAEPRKTAAAAVANQKAPSGPLFDAVRQLDPQVLRRHLHLTASASWKDAQGVHFDSWIE